VKPQYSQYPGHLPKRKTQTFGAQLNTVDKKANNSSYAAVSFIIVFYCPVTGMLVYMSISTRSSSKALVIVGSIAMKQGHEQ
jgi:hypothetical protein